MADKRPGWFLLGESLSGRYLGSRSEWSNIEASNESYSVRITTVLSVLYEMWKCGNVEI